jgi:hypothetical protein
MFAKVFAFELRYHLKSRLFLFSAIIFFLLTLLSVASPNVQIGGLGGANFNSPLAIVQTHLIMAILAVLVGTAFLSSAALRDADFRMSGIVYSTRITRNAYVFARFLGAFLATYLAYLATSLGFMAGAAAPWLDQELIGPFAFSHYAYATLIVGLPALFVNSSIVYAVAVISRDQRIAYAAIIALLVINQVASAVLGQMDYREIAALVDPTGGSAIGDAIQYWTIFERNTQLVPFSGALLENRLLWTMIGLAMLAVSYWRFRFETAEGKRGRTIAVDTGNETIARNANTTDFPRISANFSGNSGWAQFRARTRFEVKNVIRSVFFWVLVALAVANAMGSFFGLSAIFGTELYPVTRVLTNLMRGTVTLSLLVLIVFYGAELVWRDREVRFQDILGSTPTPSWAFVLAKMVAAVLVVLIFLLVSVATAVLFQLFNGYTNIEPGLYFVGFVYDYGYSFALAVVLSVVVQIVSPNKYFGMLLMVLYVLGLIILPGAGFEDPLYIYGSNGPVSYSDMNGFDGQLKISLWYNLYWTCFAVLLGVLGYLLWMRGPEESLRLRLRNIGVNANAMTRLIAGIAALGFVSFGSWIFYNTHIVNEYLTADDQRTQLAEFERRYLHLDKLAVPKITDVQVDVELYPADKAYAVTGKFMVENRTGSPLVDVPVGFALNLEVNNITLEGAVLNETDEEFNLYQFRFEPALQPGARRALDFSITRDPKGFVHGSNLADLSAGGGVFGNGSFVNSGVLAPYLGFPSGILLTDRADRAREELEPVRRAADLDDETHWYEGFVTDADWINFEMTVTTDADQVAIAPGYLQSESLEGDRRRFHYKMDAPMQNFYAVLSARYETLVEEWNGIELSVYYHPGHSWNVERMMHSLKVSLEYFTSNFSPYQYRQMRVLEFPAYAAFAQSFPNTVPWSEGIGFIADLTDPESIDYVFYVGAHEVAHQWWAHQVSSANVQGQTSLIETLAQYSALMVMEQEYGPHLMRRFLKFELDRYLSGRGGEAMEELPLYRVENQPYIHYRKGSVAMYAIKDAMGEDAVNRALASLIAEKAYHYSPYPISRDLIRHLRAEATTQPQQDLITDLFEKIILWDMKVKEASVTERDDGRFDVTINVSATKFEADGEGQQTEVPLVMDVDIGIFSENPDDVTEGDAHVLFFEKHNITSGEHSMSYVVDKRPTHVGIDPYNKLIDRNSDDNIDKVEEG